MKLLIIFLLLSGCAIVPPLKPTQNNKHITATIIINDSIGNDKKGRTILGETWYIDKKGTCIFILPTVRDVYDAKNMCVWGHELLHCVMGSFHTDDEGSSC